ncbi:MAG: DSD1 family PLP-dependent enzyme [Gammaproteobacteria bacterium]|nr:DSD1 family PLP-dependent enzyme [Gammaproteobacteria bacterium]
METLVTPALLLDRNVLDRNISRMRSRAGGLGVALRPHLKTAKSIDVARRISRPQPPKVTVSTLAEAEYFAGFGVTDILYGVSMVPSKAHRVFGLYRRGAPVKLILDDAAVAAELNRLASQASITLDVLIELDVDGHRAGIECKDGRVEELGKRIERASHLNLLGVMTHAGESYHCDGRQALEAHAETERLGAVTAAARLRRAGVPCEMVSVGSTPTALAARDLSGVTELRAGVLVFFDLFQVGVGGWGHGAVACSVLATVISHNRGRGRMLCDAGGIALSKDRSTAQQRLDCGFGLVADASSGTLLEGLIVERVDQEHGIIPVRSNADFAAHPVGSRVRIYPNHICMTAAAFDSYHVLSGGRLTNERWLRCSGW